MTPTHDPTTCGTCAPIIASAPYRRGVARALDARRQTDEEAARAPGRLDAHADLLAPELVPLDELVAQR